MECLMNILHFSIFEDLMTCTKIFLWKYPRAIALITIIASIGVLLKTRSRKQPPGPWGWPFIGHLKYFKDKYYIGLFRLKDRYGDVYKLRLGSQEFIVVCSLESILEALVGSGKAYCGRPDILSYNILYKGGRQRGVDTADFHEMLKIKRSFIDASFDAYCSNIETIEDKITIEVLEVMDCFLEKSEPIDPFFMLEASCLNITMMLVFGERLDPRKKITSDLLTIFHERSLLKAFTPDDYIPLLKAFKTDDHVDYIKAITSRQIENQSKLINLHKDTYDPSKLRDMVDHLLLFIECGQDLSLLNKDDMDYLLLDLVNYGYEAISVLVTWLIGYMAANPNIQVKVQEEIDSVVERDRPPSLRDHPFLPYTTAVILETQRMASVFPFLIPHVVTENRILQGYSIKTGTTVLFHIWSLHHDTRYWKNPMKFNPNRFLNEDKDLEIPDYYMPYGAGLRQCAGESLAEIELFLFFTTIMQQLTFTAEQSPLILEPEFDFLIRPKPFRVSVTER
ncbi:hypothetical protein SNE40_006459 [Patella caerulea]|uniref:unspecific monooxygenase n=1 Tax=Patella caerulea TaxID=87958 RepID=A0AAN8PTM2_PATCE